MLVFADNTMLSVTFDEDSLLHDERYRPGDMNIFVTRVRETITSIA